MLNFFSNTQPKTVEILSNTQYQKQKEKKDRENLILC